MRWIECNSTNSVDECSYLNRGISCGVTPPSLSRTILLDGDADIEWADRNEVRIDRVVGNINVAMQTRIEGGTGNWQEPTFRLGILLHEEVEDLAELGPIDLWDRESVEEYEWLWLWEGMSETHFTLNLGTENHRIFGRVHVPIDLRVKRKMGKKDLLVLYHQQRVESDVAFFDIGSIIQWQLRAALVG